MGRLQAEDMVNTGMFPMETMLYWHLSGNCYPSVAEFIEVAKVAIDMANEGLWDGTVDDYSPMAFCQGASTGLRPTACNPKLSIFNAAFSSLSSDSSQQGHSKCRFDNLSFCR